TPLTAIKTQLQVARMTQGERADHALHQAERAVERLQTTLEQLLLLARLDGNAAFADEPALGADEITSSALTDVSAKASQKGVQIQYQVTRAEPVGAPTARVSTAVRHLRGNPIRVSPPGRRARPAA